MSCDEYTIGVTREQARENLIRLTRAARNRNPPGPTASQREIDEYDYAVREARARIETAAMNWLWHEEQDQIG